jgi:hypothetical protein
MTSDSGHVSRCVTDRPSTVTRSVAASLKTYSKGETRAFVADWGILICCSLFHVTVCFVADDLAEMEKRAGPNEAPFFYFAS